MQRKKGGIFGFGILGSRKEKQVPPSDKDVHACPERIVDLTSLIDDLVHDATSRKADRTSVSPLKIYFRKLEDNVTRVVQDCCVREPKDMDFWSMLGEIDKAFNNDDAEELIYYLEELKSRMRQIELWTNL